MRVFLIEAADLDAIVSLSGDMNCLENVKSLNCCGLHVSLAGDVNTLFDEIRVVVHLIIDESVAAQKMS